MSRRYLTVEEASATLRRGKSVEIFLGGFDHEGKGCIRWATFSSSVKSVAGNLWEAIDQGSEDYVDLYTFNSLSGDYNDPVKSVISDGIESAASQLGIGELKFVNQGVVQDEYLSYLSNRI